MPAKRKRAARPRPVHFETTIPRIRTCGRCGVWFAAAVVEGQKAEVEFVPLDLGQRIWAIVNKIELYAFMRLGLVRMHSWRMGDPRFTVLYPQHRCDVSWPKPQGAVQRSTQADIPPY